MTWMPTEPKRSGDGGPDTGLGEQVTRQAGHSFCCTWHSSLSPKSVPQRLVPQTPASDPHTGGYSGVFTEVGVSPAL